MKRLLASLLPRRRGPRIPVVPVQMDVIEPLLKRVAEAERARARRQPRQHPLQRLLALGGAFLSIADGRGQPRLQTVPVRRPRSR